MKSLLLAIALSLALPAVCTGDTRKEPQAAPEAAPAAQASTERPTGSLWNPSSRGLVSDRRAHRIGDTITIVVQETTTGSSRANTKTSRNDKVEFGGLSSGLATLNRLLKGFGTSTSGSASGQGQTDRTGSLTTRLTVLVKEVQPNGNLVVEGTREMTINKEKQRVTISGTVRPDDVSADNTVSSVAIANASIQLDGRGPVADRQRKGLLSTLFDWLF